MQKRSIYFYLSYFKFCAFVIFLTFYSAFIKGNITMQLKAFFLHVGFFGKIMCYLSHLDAFGFISACFCASVLTGSRSYLSQNVIIDCYRKEKKNKASNYRKEALH